MAKTTPMRLIELMVHKEDIKMVQDQEVIVVRNEIIPIIRLRDVLGLPEEEDKEMEKARMADLDQ